MGQDTAQASAPPRPEPPVVAGVAALVALADGAHYRVFAGSRDGVDVVVKIPKPAVAEDRVRLLRGLEHDGIPKLLDEVATEHGPALVLQRVRGATLAKLVADGRYRRSEAGTLALMSEAALVLAYLHALRPRIVHRDFTPGSLMLDDDGRLHLIDLSAALDDPRLPLTGAEPGVGAPHFVPAEQLTEGRASAAADVYALGATFSFLLTGLDPAEVPRRAMVPDLEALGVSAAVAHLVARCMDLDADARPTAEAVAVEASVLATGSLAPPVPTAPPFTASAPPAPMTPSAPPAPMMPSAPPFTATAPPAPMMPSAPPAPMTPSAPPFTAPSPSTQPPLSAPPAPMTSSPLMPIATGAAPPVTGTLSSFPVPPPAEDAPIPLALPAPGAIDPLDDRTGPPITKQSRLDELWAAVQADPEDEAVNDAFIDFAVNSNQYAAGAARYGALADAGGPHAARAAECRRRIGVRAAGRIIATAPKAAAPQRMGNLSKAGFAIFGTATVVGLVMSSWLWFAAGTPFLALAIEAWRRGRA